jgi:hypothetical protein
MSIAPALVLREGDRDRLAELARLPSVPSGLAKRARMVQLAADGPPALMQVRLDGKAIRGAKDADGNQVRLLAALVGPDAATSVVAAQAEVGKKTNEVPVAKVVRDQISLHGKIVTADALHTVKATASSCSR